jgi:hypothetical protein
VADAASPAYGGGRERVRHVWGSLRERLGRRPAGNGGNGNDDESGSGGSGNEQQSDANGRTRPNGTPIDAREIMLAEMARAFNLGLGLSSASPAPDAAAGADSEGGNGQPESGGSPLITSPSSGGTAGVPDVPLPAEGSFERFLVDLQADLRAALSAQDPPANQLPHSQRSDEGTIIPDISPLPSTPSSSWPSTVGDQDAQPQAEETPGIPNAGFLSPLPPSIRLTSGTSADTEVESDQNLPPPPPRPPTYTASSPRQEDEAEGDQELPEGESVPPVPASFRLATR